MRYIKSPNIVFFSILFSLTVFLVRAQEPKIIKVIDLKNLFQKNDGTYVVNFWATWCKPCVEEIDHFEKLASEYQYKNVKVIFISLDFRKDFEKMRRFIEEKNIKSTVYLLDEPDYDSWINQVNSSWSGAIPATLIFNESKKEFYEQIFDYQSLTNKVNLFINEKRY